VLARVVSQHACKLVVDYWKQTTSFTSAARQGEKTTARHHQTWQAAALGRVSKPRFFGRL
jgi:hypothetical protein